MSVQTLILKMVPPGGIEPLLKNLQKDIRFTVIQKRKVL